jgi:hypothetical protein
MVTVKNCQITWYRQTILMVDTRSKTGVVFLGVLWTAVSMCYVASPLFVFVYIQQQR